MSSPSPLAADLAAYESWLNQHIEKKANERRKQLEDAKAFTDLARKFFAKYVLPYLDSTVAKLQQLGEVAVGELEGPGAGRTIMIRKSEGQDSDDECAYISLIVVILPGGTGPRDLHVHASVVPADPGSSVSEDDIPFQADVEIPPNAESAVAALRTLMQGAVAHLLEIL